MSHNFANFLGEPVILNQSGTLYHVPAGWTGSLNLAGTVEVAKATGIQATTNITAQIEMGTNTVGGTDISVSMATPGYAVTLNPPGFLPWGQTAYAQVTDAGGASLGQYPIAANDAISENWEFSVNNGQVQYVGTPIFAPGVTNYTTNVTTQTQPGAVIGAYTAVPQLRAVEVNSAGITLHDYSLEATSAVAGFSLAVTISVFRFVIRMIKAMPGSAGDI